MTPFIVKYRMERERRPYRPEEVRQLPKDRIGLYALWLPSGGPDEYECLYVGKSETCIRERLAQHLRHESNPILCKELQIFRGSVEFSYTFTTGDDETDALETAVIQAWKPRANRNKLQG